MRKATWVATALVLAAALLLVPQLAPGARDDAFPRDVGLGDRAELWGGSVRVDEVVASPRWTDGDTELSLEKQGGLFVRVTVTARPAKEARPVNGLIVQGGRAWDLSDGDRADVSPGHTPAGFDTKVELVFEVPAEAVREGELRLFFETGSEASLSLGSDTVERADVLEASE